MKQTIFYTAIFALVALPAVSDVTVRFQDGAPKDRFVISTDCAISDIDMSIDLSRSAGSLIFDVTADGAGVEVFQPVEVQSGTAQIQPVIDGDQRLAFRIAALASGADVVISADLDDILPDSALGQIRVSGAELDGAQVRIVFAGLDETARFANGSNQITFAHGCLS